MGADVEAVGAADVTGADRAKELALADAGATGVCLGEGPGLGVGAPQARNAAVGRIVRAIGRTDSMNQRRMVGATVAGLAIRWCENPSMRRSQRSPNVRCLRSWVPRDPVPGGLVVMTTTAI